MMLCPGCGQPLAGKNAYCSLACSRRVAKRRARAAEHSTGTTEALGPAIPLDGLTDAERHRRRDKRIASVLRDGVPISAVAERFGVSEAHVAHVASLNRISTRYSYQIPFGSPA